MSAAAFIHYCIRTNWRQNLTKLSLLTRIRAVKVYDYHCMIKQLRNPSVATKRRRCPYYRGMFIQKTRCPAIAERPRCSVSYSFRQKQKTGTGRQYFTDIIGLPSTTVIKSAWKSAGFVEKTKNKGYYGVQRHSRSSRSVPIESPYAISY